MPTALEILEKYVGKPYGEKTKEKISNEVNEKTGCGFYIEYRYSYQSYAIYPLEACSKSISCGTKYVNGDRKPLLIDNKIQPITFEELELWYISPDYVEDVTMRIEELNSLYIDAVKRQKELAEICDKFNDLAIGDIPHIYSDKRIDETMRI